MTEFGAGGTGESGEDGLSSAFEHYGKSFHTLGQELLRKRIFIGRMVTHEYMNTLGLLGVGDDETQAILADTLNQYVVSGILLEAKQAADDDAVEKTVAYFRHELPDDLQNSIGLLVPLFVARGIEFQANERGSEKEQQWLQEYALLYEATSE